VLRKGLPRQKRKLRRMNKDSILFVDTETTGLIPKGANYKQHYVSFPGIVSLTWFAKEQNHFIINQDGLSIPEESTKIHGITTEEANKSKYHLTEVLEWFMEDAAKAQIIVGHNLYYDTLVIKASLLCNEMYPALMEPVLSKNKRIDTMRSSIKFCGLKVPGSNRTKFPTLIELHQKLFGESFNAHNSYDDVEATRRCFYELIKRGVIKLQS
jgi:DNA polymerase III epsilon subunit-like protein